MNNVSRSEWTEEACIIFQLHNPRDSHGKLAGQESFPSELKFAHAYAQLSGTYDTLKRAKLCNLKFYEGWVIVDDTAGDTANCLIISGTIRWRACRLSLVVSCHGLSDRATLTNPNLKVSKATLPLQSSLFQRIIMKFVWIIPVAFSVTSLETKAALRRPPGPESCLRELC